MVLLDLRLPDGDGLEVLSRIRARKLPLAAMVLTGCGSRDAAIAALRAGTDDYLVKDNDYLERLPAALTRALAHYQAHQDRWSRGLRVLFAEHDQQKVERVRNHLLAHTPHIVLETVKSGAALLARLHAELPPPWDLLLLDLQLPDQDVLTLVRTLRDDPRFELPVVLLGERDSEAKVVKALHLGMAGFRDITGRRLTDERLRLQAAALQASRDGVMITDLKPAIIAVNPAFCEITGYTEEEVLGQNPNMFSSGRHGHEFFQAMWSGIKTHGHWRGEIWNRRKSGEIYPELLSISTVYDDRQQPSHYVGVKTDLSRLRSSEEQLQYLAHHDPLTGLSNRLLLESRLEHSLERARRERTRLAVLLFNLDRFRLVNESLGYAAGDRLLVEVIKRLQKRLRADDTMARLAGDEFVLLLEGIGDYQEAERVAGWFQEALAQPFPLPEGGEVYIQTSIGISIYPQDGETMAALLAGADAALNLAKAAGGNQFFYATAADNTRARHNLELESALRQALKKQEFLLYYQPKVNFLSGRISGAEALIRWQRPGHGLVPPGEFIPMAERSGLIVEIGAWVIAEACRQMRAWREEGLGDIRLAANVSARQFLGEGLPELVRLALDEHRVLPAHLTLELTESMLMFRPEEAISRMTALKELGIKLALDDFGTGYSSFASLSRFPIDQLKIDRGFVQALVDCPDAASIAASIIAMAHRMHLQVVAEGVENEAQCGYLRRNHCDELQGFLFRPPLPAAEFADLLRRGETLPLADEPEELRSLLVVDDDPHVLSALRRLLSEENYRLLTAADAAEGLRLLAENRIEVIISDQRMPGMSGTEFLRRAKDIYPDTVRMVLSGYADLETVVEAVNEGALYKFLAKPWQDELLLANINDAFLYYEAIVKPRLQR